MSFLLLFLTLTFSFVLVSVKKASLGLLLGVTLGGYRVLCRPTLNLLVHRGLDNFPLQVRRAKDWVENALLLAALE